MMTKRQGQVGTKWKALPDACFNLGLEELAIKTFDLKSRV